MPNQTCAMDIMSDTLFDNRAYRILTLMDCHSREEAVAGAAPELPRVSGIVRERGKPKAIRCDNGPEFAGRVLDQWAFFNEVELAFSRPATSTNASVRRELPNASWVTSLVDARRA